MSDWEKLKVVELKDELKSRGIPLTGLKLKQQFIDKLVEIENQTETEPEQTSVPESQSEKQETHVSAHSSQTGEKSDAEAITDGTQDADENADTGTPVDEKPVLLKEGESRANDDIDTPLVEAQQPQHLEEIARDDTFIPDINGAISEQDTLTQALDDAQQKQDKRTLPAEKLLELDTEMVDTAIEPEFVLSNGPDTEGPDSPPSTKVPTPEILDDQRKRKRRSESPPLESRDFAYKKTKIGDDGKSPTRRESGALEQIQGATDEAESARETINSMQEDIQTAPSRSDRNEQMVDEDTTPLPPDTTDVDITATRSDHPRSETRHQEFEESFRQVNPARHPATASLYIRNFKRPLHIPTLRAHISSQAKGPRPDSERDPVKTFYLDNIRTHAFITFDSISAASRVRNAMHDTQYPDEPMREPLWVDFIPDEKVQTWIDEETYSGSGGFGGARGGNRKYEVIYLETAHGIEVVLQDTSGETSRPVLGQQRPSRPLQSDRNMSTSAPGHEPGQAKNVSQTPSRTVSQNPRSDTGTGFKALDELFSSTRAKPKLYFKLPDQSIIDDRFEMIRELRVGHNDMGRSGDEGMKRYTFEDYKGREEWVDKGPEFGFGRKGQEKLAGYRGRGGHRGGRRGGDTWRGR